MVELAQQWTMDVERGPNCLFIRLHGPENGEAEGSDLANRIWEILEQHFTYGLVLEFDDIELLRSYLLGQLVILHKRIQSHDGMLRLSGLSEDHVAALKACRLDHSFSRYCTREDAIMGHGPVKPR
jgi:anti-anti-sigma regulatory factor